MTATTPLRAALARVLGEHSTAIADELTEMLAASLPSLSGEGEPDWFRTSIQGNVEAILHLIAYPEDLPYAEPPVGAVALVHRYARRGLALYEVLHAYHLCELRWQQLCMEHLVKLTDDAAELVSETVALGTMVHAYLDQVSRRISVEYETERSRWAAQEESARASRVLSLLDGSYDDVAAAEETLGYRLRQRHLAAIVWRESREDTAADQQVVARIVRQAAERLGTAGRPLVVARDLANAWAWLALPGEAGLDLAAWHEIAATAPHIRIALGDPQSGPEGFTRSHRQATTAYEVARAAGPEGPSVVPYSEVSSLVFLCNDLVRARRWVGEVLGALAVDERRENELRHTLAVYCRAHRSPVAAARELSCHKNTVLFRLNAAEQLLGRPIDSVGLDLDLAVRACEWLGPRLIGGP
ncbi:MAG: PucR family transcriptional regulator [Sporichthyaceae bacterium]